MVDNKHGEIIKASFHGHTKWSDGGYFWLDVLDYAAHAGCNLFALTDHDDTRALSTEALQDPATKKWLDHHSVILKPTNYGSFMYGMGVGADAIMNCMEVIRGIELTFMEDTLDNSPHIHLVGLFIEDPTSDFQNHLSSVQSHRYDRIMEMTHKIADIYGISELEVRTKIGESVASRLHLASVLKKKLGPKVAHLTAHEVMDTYIGINSVHPTTNEPIYRPVEDYLFNSYGAIEGILSMNGIPVVPHPHRLPEMLKGGSNFKRFLESILCTFDQVRNELGIASKTNGAFALEVYCNGMTDEEKTFYERTADEFGILKSASTDLHGGEFGPDKYSLDVPSAWFYAMKEKAINMRPNIIINEE